MQQQPDRSHQMTQWLANYSHSVYPKPVFNIPLLIPVLFPEIYWGAPRLGPGGPKQRGIPSFSPGEGAATGPKQWPARPSHAIGKPFAYLLQDYDLQAMAYILLSSGAGRTDSFDHHY